MYLVLSVFEDYLYIIRLQGRALLFIHYFFVENKIKIGESFFFFTIRHLSNEYKKIFIY